MPRSPKRMRLPPTNAGPQLAVDHLSHLPAGQTTTMTIRVRKVTAEAIATSAREQNLTMKQVICKALTEAGISVAAVDLEDRTPRRH